MLISKAPSISCEVFIFDVEYNIWTWPKYHTIYFRTVGIEWKHLYECPCQNEGVGLNFAEWLICTSLPWFLRKVFGIISFKTMFLASSYFYSIGTKEHLQMRVSFDNNFGTAYFSYAYYLTIYETYCMVQIRIGTTNNFTILLICFIQF